MLSLLAMNNIYDEIPDNPPNEIFEQLVENDRVCIERIVSKGHRSPESGWYDQQRNEWVMLLQGGAVLRFDDETTITLKPGDYISIAARRKHRVDWTDPDTTTIWLAVHY
jgi:cupin 2 domain-containing protein